MWIGAGMSVVCELSYIVGWRVSEKPRYFVIYFLSVEKILVIWKRVAECRLSRINPLPFLVFLG